MTEEEQIEAELIERELNKRNSKKKSNLFNGISKSIQSNPIGQAGLGFAQGLADIAPGIGNLAIKGSNYANKTNVPEFKGFHFAPDTLASKGGELGSYFAGGGLLKAVSNLPKIAKAGEVFLDLLNKFSKGSPHLEKIAKALSSNTAKYMGGGAAVGAIQSPENQGSGALLGAAIPGAFSAAKSIKNNAKPIYEKLSDIFSPAKHGNKLLEDISHGSKNLKETDKAIAADVRNGYEMRKAETDPYYNHAFDIAGEKKIYEAHDPLISTKVNKQENMLNKLDKLNLGKTFEEFKANPNFKNAHDIQSELFTRIADLKKAVKSNPELRNELHSLESARSELKADIRNMLERHDSKSNTPVLPVYEKASELHKINVEPYLEDKRLREVTKGGKEYIKNIHKAFENTSGKKNKKTDEFDISNIDKIMQDLPPEIKEKILFRRLKGNKFKNNPTSLLEEIRSVENEGGHLSQELKDKFGIISKADKRKGQAKNGAMGFGAAIAAEEGLRHLL